MKFHSWSINYRILHLVVRACISIRFSPITRVNIVVSYIIYIYYNKEKGGLESMGTYILILMFVLVAIAVTFATYNLSMIKSMPPEERYNSSILKMIKSL